MSLTRYLDPYPMPMAPLLLGQISGGASAAFALRLIRAWHLGPLARIRRSSDNAETMIGYARGPRTTQNVHTNTALAGAVVGTPGTLPTGWQIFSNTTGCALNVTATGTDPATGYPSVVVQLVGASTGGQLRLVISSPVAAAEGQRFCLSIGHRMTAGSLTNITSLQLVQRFRNITSGTLLSTIQNFTPTSIQPLRVGVSGVGPVDTVQNTNEIVISTGAGAVDVTLRLIAPNIEIGPAINARTLLNNSVTTVTDAGGLDIDAVEAFIGSGGTAQVVTWFDQSGAAKDVTNATAANQPFLATTGCLETTQTGRPGVRFAGGSGSLRGASTVVAFQAHSVSNTSATTAGFEYMSGGGANGLFVDRKSSTQRRVGKFGVTVNSTTDSANGQTAVYTDIASGIRRNGTNLTMVSDSIGSESNVLEIGGRNSLSGFIGTIAELILLPQETDAATRTLIEQNQGAYFGVAIA